MPTLFELLKQRRILQWAVAYLAAAWLILQVAQVLGEIFAWPAVLLRGLAVVLGFGVPVVLVLANYHGQRGRQRKRSGELALLVVILVVAGFALRFIDLGPGPSQVTTDRTATRSVFADSSTRRLTATSESESEPSFSPDSLSVVHVSEQSGNADLWVKTIADGKTVPLTDDPADDMQPAWSPDGRHVAFVSSRNHGDKLDQSVFLGYSLGGGIWVVPAFGGEARPVIDGGFNPTWSADSAMLAYDSSADGPRRIWISSSDGSDSRRLTDDPSDLAAHTRPAWSPDGRWIAYERQEGSQSSASNLRLTTADGDEAIAITNDDARDFSPAWAGPVRLVFSSDRGGAINLWQIDIDPETGQPAGRPVRITVGAGDDLDPAVSTDGKLAYVNIRRWQNMWSITVEPELWQVTGEPQALMDTAWNDIAPAIAPDGSGIAFPSDRQGDFDLWRLDEDVSEPTPITSGGGQDLQPDWSYGGQHIAFFSDRSGNNEIYIVPALGGTPVQITDDPADDINPYWSPDSSWIAFMSDRSGQSEIWVMGVDGSNPQQLTTISATGHTARWSPDGTWILFTSISGGDRNIWAVSPDGDKLRQLTSAPSQDAHGLWSPDGSWFLYLSGHRAIYAAQLDGGAPVLVYDPGERIDYTHITRDGKGILFTRERIEGELWLLE